MAGQNGTCKVRRTGRERNRRDNVPWAESRTENEANTPDPRPTPDRRDCVICMSRGVADALSHVSLTSEYSTAVRTEGTDKRTLKRRDSSTVSKEDHLGKNQDPVDPGGVINDK